VTSHLQGMFSRTIRMLQHGLKPVYVFDGAPPEMKTKVLASRREKAQVCAGDAIDRLLG